MHEAKRFTVSRNSITLGPGTYDSPSKVGEGPKCTIRPRTAMPKRPEVPGPGQYEPAFSSVTKRVGISITRGSKRNTLFVQENKIPGPGAYYEESKKLKGPVFSFKKSKEVQPKPSELGPGSYKIPSTIANWPSYTMNKKNNQYQYI